MPGIERTGGGAGPDAWYGPMDDPSATLPAAPRALRSPALEDDARLVGIAAGAAEPLRRGDRSEATRALQSALDAAGFPAEGGVDGIFGRGTESALARFQRDHGLTPGGALDADTLVALDRALADAAHAVEGAEGDPSVAPVGAPPVRLADLPSVPVREMSNDAGTFAFTPRAAFRPTSIDEVAAVMRFAAESGRRVKPIGSLHSSSTAPVADDILLHPEGLSWTHSPERLAASGELRAGVDPVGEHLVRAGSGTQIRTLNRTLWERHGLALPNMGGYDEQTIAGAVSTATHGSGLAFGPISDLVESMDLVLPGGRKVRIEPANGITDPVAFARLHPDMELIQDDAYFDASVVSMGSLGVSVSYVLGVREKYYLDEQRTVTTWSDVRDRLLADGGVYDLMTGPGRPDSRSHRFPARHVELLVNPYARGGERTVVITTRKEVPGSVADGVEHRNRNLLNRIHDPDHNRPWLNETVLDHAPNALGSATRNLMTRLVPGSAPALIDASMKSLEDERYVERSYHVLNIGAANNVDAYAAEIAVPLRGDAYVRALEALMQRARAFAEEGKVHTAPIAVRFVRSSDALLAPQQEDVAMFEIIFTKGTPHADEMLRAYQEVLAPFGGRPHFGQRNWMDPDRVRAAYGSNLDTFSAVRDALDPDGVMRNAFTDRTLGTG